jgi:hypothetical protein
LVPSAQAYEKEGICYQTKPDCSTTPPPK